MRQVLVVLGTIEEHLSNAALAKLLCAVFDPSSSRVRLLNLLGDASAEEAADASEGWLPRKLRQIAGGGGGGGHSPRMVTELAMLLHRSEGLWEGRGTRGRLSRGRRGRRLEVDDAHERVC